MHTDAHTHLTLIEPENLENRYNILKKSFYEEKMTYIVQINLNQKELEETIIYKEEFGDKLIFAIGSHPIDITKDNIEEKLHNLEETIKRYRKQLSFIGEIGLDYYHNKDFDIQKEAFKKIIRIANKYLLPIIIHSRDAKEDTLKILKENEVKKKGIMHCFSYDYEYAKYFLELGYYISFAGNITYKKNEKLREIAKKIPIDRILVETDAPYLTPIPYRGKKNYPYYVKYTAKTVAELKNMEEEELAKQISENLEKLISN